MPQNPKIDGATTSVSTLIDGLSRTARSVNVQGTVPIPPFNGLAYHFQGIAPYNGNVPDGNGYICASSDVGYRAPVEILEQLARRPSLRDRARQRLLPYRRVPELRRSAAGGVGE